MGAMASQITTLTIVYSAVYSGADTKSKLRVTGLCAGNSPVTGEFPAQMPSNAENISIWWRHHESDVLSVLWMSPWQVICDVYSELDIKRAPCILTKLSQWVMYAPYCVTLIFQ